MYSYIYSYALFEMVYGFELDIVAACTAGAAVIAYTYKKVIKPSLSWSRSMVESLTKIDAIHEQMFTNGGKTLRDAVNRIENRMTLLEKQQAIYIMDTPHGVFNTGPDGRFTYVNRTLCRVTGKTESELLGAGWINSVDEADRERVDRSWEYALENGIEYTTSFTMVDSDGVKFIAKLTANPMKTQDGRVIGYLGIIDHNG